MNEMIDELNRFYVFVSDLLAIDNVPCIEVNNDLEYISGVEVENGKAKRIMVNLETMPTEVETLFWCLAHELRHVAQLEAIDEEENLDYSDLEKEIIRKELANYQPHGNAHKNQFIEIDAFAFADFIMWICFSLDRTYGKDITPKVLGDIKHRARVISTQYSKEEILDCLRYSGFQPKKPLNYS